MLPFYLPINNNTRGMIKSQWGKSSRNQEETWGKFT